MATFTDGRHCEQDIQAALADALDFNIHTQILPGHGPESPHGGGDLLTRYLLPSNGPCQQQRRVVYGKEILSGIAADGQEEHVKSLDGFSVGVPTGLERSLGWKGAACNLTAYSMTVGIFSLPRCAAVLGFFPFVFLVLVFQYITWLTGMAYARLQQRYPGIHSVPVAAHLIYGDAGQAIMACSQLLFSVMLSGNHIILGTYALRALGWKSCAVALNVVFAIVAFLTSLPRSYRLFANLAFVSALSVIVCMVVVCVAAGINGPYSPPSAVQPKKLRAFGPYSDEDADFFTIVLAITNLFFSFGAHPCFLPLMGEMRYPHHFPKSLLALISVQTTLSLVMTGSLLHSLGEYTTSPIVASLGPSQQRVCYILALPALVISGSSSGQVCAKQIYIFALRKIPSIKSKTSSTWLAWALINLATWTSAWILAELVPFFGSFMALESSFIWVLYVAIGGVFALFLNMGQLTATWHARSQTASALLLIVFCLFLAVAGLWSAVRAIIDSYTQGSVDYPFNCDLSAG